ncbi:MAG: hypothetical protein MZV63_28760 [Marinilabiliales bacterium]|nr:hypothetical protein [Marinilabiliales bacterium]
MKSFTTKNGKGEFTTQDFPKRWEAEYFWKGYRARCMNCAWSHMATRSRA